jgi:APA family basic amino acid/polyamine antiporter
LAYTAIAFPNSNLALIMLLSTIIMFFVAYVYGQLSAAMPRSGRDYVWLSRIVHPAFGFVMNFYLTAFLLILVGLIVVPFLLMPSLSATMVVAGTLTNNSSLIDLAATAVTPSIATLIGIVTITFGCLLNVVRMRNLYKVLIGMLVVSLAGLLAAIVLLFATPTSAFAAGFDKLVAIPGAYGNVVKEARAEGYTPGWTIGASLLALPYGIQSLTGFQFSAYVSEGVKSPSKKVPLSILVALVIGGVLYVLGYQAAYTGAGYDFVNGGIFLQTYHPTLYPSGSPALVPYLIAALPTSPMLIVFAEFAFLIACLWLVVTYYPFATRNMLAWSFDGITPRMLADVSDRFKTPVKAVALCWLFSIIGVFVAYYYPRFAVVTGNLIVGYSFVLTVVMPVAAAFPYLGKGKQIFESAPPLSRQKLGPLPLIVAFALIGATGCGLAVYSGVTNPLVGGVIAPESGGFLLALFIIPLLIYYVAKAYRKIKGIDMSLAFQEIPPE